MSKPLIQADIVGRLNAAAEHDEGIPPAEAQALFLEAADHIEHLRALLPEYVDITLETVRPGGNA